MIDRVLVALGCGLSLVIGAFLVKCVLAGSEPGVIALLFFGFVSVVAGTLSAAEEIR